MSMISAINTITSITKSAPSWRSICFDQNNGHTSTTDTVFDPFNFYKAYYIFDQDLILASFYALPDLPLDCVEPDDEGRRSVCSDESCCCNGFGCLYCDNIDHYCCSNMSCICKKNGPFYECLYGCDSQTFCESCLNKYCLLCRGDPKGCQCCEYLWGEFMDKKFPCDHVLENLKGARNDDIDVVKGIAPKRKLTCIKVPKDLVLSEGDPRAKYFGKQRYTSNTVKQLRTKPKKTRKQKDKTGKRYKFEDY